MKFIVKKIQEKQNIVKLFFDEYTIFEIGKQLKRKQSKIRNNNFQNVKKI